MKQTHYWDYCEIEKQVTKFVNDVRGTKVICCSCAYAKPINQKKERDKPEMKTKVKTNLRL